MGADQRDTIHVVIADDHALVREGTRELIEREHDITVVGEAGDGREALELVEAHQPDVALLDITMPNMGGIEATREIKARFPRIAVLILTIHDDEEYVVALLEAGAAGYLLKDVGHGELVDAIRAVHGGESVLHPAVTRAVLERLRTTAAPSDSGETGDAEQVRQPILTGREQEVLQAAATGAANKEIAAHLDVGVRTVQTHLANVYDKLHVASRTEAVIEGLRRGLVDLDEPEVDDTSGAGG